jgi:hypothetical protein
MPPVAKVEESQHVPLSDEYIAQVVMDARRFQGAFTGTAGTLAAHCIRLVNERRELMAASQEISAEPIGDSFPVLGDRLTGDGLLATPEDQRNDPVDPRTLRPGTAEFLAVLDEVRELHLRKTLDYGADEDALANIRSSSDVIGVQAWAGCILRISDKMFRLRSFFRRGKTEFDGVEDTLLDICAYSAIALAIYRDKR